MLKADIELIRSIFNYVPETGMFVRLTMIRVDGKYKSLGYFKEAESAHAAYVDAARKYYGEFARVQ